MVKLPLSSHSPKVEAMQSFYHSPCTTFSQLAEILSKGSQRNILTEAFPHLPNRSYVTRAIDDNSYDTNQEI